MYPRYWHIMCAWRALCRGGVVAYPTEAVYGLGCLPANERAVRHILRIKRRPREKKGLIIVAASIPQIMPFIDRAILGNIGSVFSTWPGPITWVFPASDKLPAWLVSDDDTVAIRVSADPVIQALCRRAGPLISTSANRSGFAPARSADKIRQYFPRQVDYIYPGQLSIGGMPTEIRDACSGGIIRSARRCEPRG